MRGERHLPCSARRMQSRSCSKTLRLARRAEMVVTHGSLSWARAKAILRQLPRFFEATGSLAANEQTDVAPSIAGKVVAIGVDLGSFVKRGQMIVRLDPIDLRLRLDHQCAQ